MGLTGVIYAIIVVTWAFFLIPLALRRHDRAARNHSIERFSSAMRVLARRGDSADRGRVVVAPARPVDRVVTPSLHQRDEADVSYGPRPTRAAMRQAAQRRRRVLVVLVAVTVLVAAVASFGVVPWWSVAVPVGLIVAFLWTARRQVRHATEQFWDEAAAARPVPSNVVRRDAVRVDASHGSARAAADDEPTVTLDAEQLRAVAVAEQRVEAVTVRTSDGGELWDPVPVTLPTYVDKPAAQRSVRTIDLGEPGTWSAGHSDADSAAAREADAERADEAVADAPRAANA